jgi:hypothetical protein
MVCVMRLALVYDCTTTIPTKGRCLDWHGNIVILSNFQQARRALEHLGECPVAFCEQQTADYAVLEKMLPHARSRAAIILPKLPMCSFISL